MKAVDTAQWVKPKHEEPSFSLPDINLDTVVLTCSLMETGDGDMVVGEENIAKTH